jgi:3-methyladenine DNA glycosylase AlkD
MKNVNSFYDEILMNLKKEEEINPMHSKLNNNYSGSDDQSLDISNKQRRGVFRKWLKSNPELTLVQYWALCDKSIRSDFADMKAFVGETLRMYKKYRDNLDINKLNEWLNYTQGWAQIDGLCQSTFSADELLEKWSDWRTLLLNLNKSEQIEKQRASLVLMIKSLRKSSEKKLFDLAYENILNITQSQDKLITKAISWILREMTKTDPDSVEAFIEENEQDLPAIAVRETRTKLKTGKKN